MNEPAIEYIQDLSEKRFFGVVTFMFENGQVVHIKQEQNIKPNNLPTGKSRGNYEANNKR